MPAGRLAFCRARTTTFHNSRVRAWTPGRQPQGAYDHPFAVAAGLQGKLPSLRWTAEAVWRELASGGRVFSAGTFYWSWALDPTWGPEHHVPPGFGRLTLNILHFLDAT